MGCKARCKTPAVCAIAVFLVAACGALVPAGRAAERQRFIYERAEMGVPFRITLFAPDEPAAREAAEAAFDRVRALNHALSDYDSDSELSRLSRTAGQGLAFPVSDDLWRVLETAQQFAERSDGAFDITVGPLVNLWRHARRQRTLPPPEKIEELRARVGYANLRLNPKARTAELRKPGMRLDLGGIAKGFAADEALRVVRSRGYGQALVAASGDTVVGDPPPGMNGWRIAITPLDADGAPRTTVAIANCGIATSGDTFQRIEINGVRYSHILDPRSGFGMTDHSLVTVIAPTGMTADALATAISVMPAADAIALINSTPEAAARIVRKTNTAIEVTVAGRWAEIPKVDP